MTGVKAEEITRGRESMKKKERRYRDMRGGESMKKAEGRKRDMRRRDSMKKEI